MNVPTKSYLHGLKKVSMALKYENKPSPTISFPYNIMILVIIPEIKYVLKRKRKLKEKEKYLDRKILA